MFGRSDMSALSEALLFNPGEKGRPLSAVVMPLNRQPSSIMPVTPCASDKNRRPLPKGR